MANFLRFAKYLAGESSLKLRLPICIMSLKMAFSHLDYALPRVRFLPIVTNKQKTQLELPAVLERHQLIRLYPRGHN